MNNSCPYCGGTTLADILENNGCICLDCEKTWIPKERRKRPRRKSARHQDYISRRDVAILGGDPSL